MEIIERIDRPVNWPFGKLISHAFLRVSLWRSLLPGAGRSCSGTPHVRQAAPSEPASFYLHLAGRREVISQCWVGRTGIVPNKQGGWRSSQDQAMMGVLIPACKDWKRWGPNISLTSSLMPSTDITPSYSTKIAFRLLNTTAPAESVAKNSNEQNPERDNGVAGAVAVCTGL